MSCIHVFNKYLLSFYYVSGKVLGTWNTSVDQIKIDLLHPTLESDNSRFHQFFPRRTGEVLFCSSSCCLGQLFSGDSHFCTGTCVYSFLHITHKTASISFLKQKSHHSSAQKHLLLPFTSKFLTLEHKTS